MSDKTYVGIGRTVKTKYGNLLSLAFSKDDIEKLQAGLQDGWVNMFVAKRREEKEGKTHYGYMFHKEPEGTPVPPIEDDGDDLAF